MSDETPYIDPNSGAAPQPGGASPTSLAEDAQLAENTERAETEQPKARRSETERIETEPGTDIGTDPNAVPDEDEKAGDEGAEGEHASSEGEGTSGEGGVRAAVADAGGIENVEGDDSGEGDQDDSGSPQGEAFDPAQPGKHTVAQVLAYIAENPDSKDAIVEAEKADRNRKKIVES